MASNIIRQSAYRSLVRRNGYFGTGTTSTAVRSFATTARSAATRDPDQNDDNILPVSLFLYIVFNDL